MNRRHIRKTLLFSGIIVCISFIVFLLFLFVETIPGHKELKIFLNEKLVWNEPLPADFKNVYPESKKVIYVLGGTQNSLKHKFKTAANLYHHGVAGKILILNDTGITEYDPLLGRNLTNNEWSFKRLIALGVKKEDIEPVSLEDGFLGTIREAQSVSHLAINREVDCLILVSSQYHTMRVRESFFKFLKDKEINIFVYKSDDYTDLWGLLLEYFKLIIYKNFLLQ